MSNSTASNLRRCAALNAPSFHSYARRRRCMLDPSSSTSSAWCKASRSLPVDTAEQTQRRASHLHVFASAGTADTLIDFDSLRRDAQLNQKVLCAACATLDETACVALGGVGIRIDDRRNIAHGQCSSVERKPREFNSIRIGKLRGVRCHIRTQLQCQTARRRVLCGRKRKQANQPNKRTTRNCRRS